MTRTKSHVRIRGIKFPLNAQGEPYCKKCRGTTLKPRRGRLGMLGFGIFAAKTVIRCETCGKRY